MSSQTIAPGSTPPEAASKPPSPQRFTWLLQAELKKYLSLKAIRVLLVLSFVLTLATSTITAWAIKALADGAEGISRANVAETIGVAPTSGAELGCAFLVIAAILAITTEYTHGSINFTNILAPRRGQTLMAKVAVGFIVAFAVTLAACLLSLGITSVIVGSNYDQTILNPELWRTVVAAALAVGLLSIFGTGLGYITRSGVGSIFSFMGLMWGVPVVLASASLMGMSWAEQLVAYFPGSLLTSARSSASTAADASNLDHPALALLILAVWSVIAVALGSFRARRD